MKAQDIVIRPIITEKSMTGVANKKYTFEVCQDANKIEIAKAVEELFGVKVQKVNTLNVRGKFRRQGRYEGYTRAWRKAVFCDGFGGFCEHIGLNAADFHFADGVQ